MATDRDVDFQMEGNSSNTVGKSNVPSSSANNSSRTDLVEETHGHYQCEQDQGTNTRYSCCCRWRPGYQCLASVRWFVVFVCLLVMSTALMIAIFQGNLTTTETRYQLSASQLGLATSMFTAGSVVSTIFVTHFGGKPKSHRPRWIGIGAVTMAFGCFIICLPQFIFGPYRYNTISTNSTSALLNTCEPDNIVTTSPPMTCEKEKHQLVYESYVAYIFIVLGQLVIGVGYGPLLPLALAFIDDHTDTATTGLYSGIIESMWGVGAIIGFQISASIAQLWVDFYRVDVESIDLTLRDPRYVGAWWLGLLVASCLFLVFSIPFWGFPKRLTQESCHQHNGSLSKNDKDGRRNMSASTFKELLLSLWRLCSNKIYMSVCASMMMQGAIIYSFSAFLPKYLENQFGLPTQKANITVGFVLVPAYGFGAILGGILVKRLHLQAQGCAMMSMIYSLLACILAVFFIILGCSNQPIVGITTGYQNQSLLEVPSLVAPCNSNCGCSPSADFSPVCGSDGMTYFSPCHAACLENVNKTYSECSCINASSEDKLATNGPCAYTGCSSLVSFLVLMFIGNALLSGIVSPRIVIIVSCVKTTEKSLAIGMSRIIMLLLGSIPGPILYGALIDTACVLWQTICNTQGSCWVYDIEQFRRVFGVTTTLIIALEFLFCTLTWIFLRFDGKNVDGGKTCRQETAEATNNEGKALQE